MPRPVLATAQSGHPTLDVFSPVNENGSFEFDRVIKLGRVHRRTKKKGAWKPSWKPACLVLRPNLLSIYKNEDETELLASILLSDVTAVSTVRKLHTDNVFGIFSPSKNYHFQGQSATDTAAWITALRTEAHVYEDDDLQPPSPQFQQPQENYESTDLSAGEERTSGFPQPPLSPRVGSKARPRKLSNVQDYSGNELATTSHSDFSDVQAGSLPKTFGSSLNLPSNLTPILSSQNLRPGTGRNASQLSGFDPLNDPERVIRQGWLQVLKTRGGVKQWKSLWVVLRARNLSFYKNEQEYSVVKIMPMSSIINAAEIDPISRSKQFCLQVIAEEKTYRLCAPDEDALARWLGALKSVFARRAERGKGLAE